MMSLFTTSGISIRIHHVILFSSAHSKQNSIAFAVFWTSTDNERQTLLKFAECDVYQDNRRYGTTKNSLRRDRALRQWTYSRFAFARAFLGEVGPSEGKPVIFL